ncbi:MAG: hypothetical protein KGZ50_01035 [Peptococcaceae bacterium]|nr:hypothetical protein [Peptococcaceae bacterium]
MTFTLNAAQSVALVLGFLLLGYGLQRMLPQLKANYVPAPLIGGLLLFLALAVAKPFIALTLDTSLSMVFATLFFASIGLRTNAKMARQGVGKMALFLGVVMAVAALQNVLSLLVGGLLGLSAPEILLHGSLVFMGDVTLAPLLQELGGGAELLPELAGVAALAVLVGTLMGGQVMKLLQKGVDLKQTIKPPSPTFSPYDFIKCLFVFAVPVALGFLPSQLGWGQWISPVGGAFLAGLLTRLVLDQTKWTELGLPQINLVGNISLSLFLTFVLATVRWDMIQFVTPLSWVIVLLQGVLVMVGAIYVCFKVFGSDALAAYIAVGLPGFSMGIPASTMATLQCVKEQHGALPMVLFVVPPVGAWLISIINPLIIRLFF